MRGDGPDDIPADRGGRLTPDELRMVAEEAAELAACAAEVQACLANLEGVELPPEVVALAEASLDRLEETSAGLRLLMTSSPGLAMVREMKAKALAALDSGVPADQVRAALLKVIEEGWAGPGDAPFRRALGHVLDGFLPGPDRGGGA